jgi:putative DNA primase/helicase
MAVEPAVHAADGVASPAADEQAFYRPHTDLGNAERLVDLEGANLIHVPGPGWYEYDGKRWRRDDSGGVMRAAKRTVRRTYEIAKAAAEQPESGVDPEIAALLAMWARGSESAYRLKSMISLAASDRALVREIDELDAAPFLLNVANGTLDLREGELRLASRDDLITKISSVVYTPGAADDVWDGVLDWIAQNHGKELVDFLQLWAGYGATGDTREDLVVLLDGPGGTGKSTFTESVSAAMGDYAAVASFDMFVQRKGDQGHPTSTAALVGARWVTAEEGPKNRNLDAAKIKALVGGTRVKARFMRQDEFEFIPNLKLTLVTNYRPKVHSEDSGAWRRLKAVPFTNVLPWASRDRRLRQYLRTDPAAQKAILAWIAEGAARWWDMAKDGRGLPIPECVEARTQEWRRDADRVGAWIEDECELDPAAWDSSERLQESINDWWKTYVTDDPSWHAPSLMASLGDELKLRGCQPERAADADGTRGWRGIRLRHKSLPFG